MHRRRLDAGGQICEKSLKFRREWPLLASVESGGPDVAVNLTGIELNGPAIGPARKAPSSSSPGAPAHSHEGSPGPDDVQITSTATLLAQLEQSLGAQPAIDQTRVDAVSHAIATGHYQLSAEQVASGLISSERALSQLPLAEI
ncbi:MAG TPA: flagellar biosynthesis anti-sigma factor FlgM [Steroidobacteraceae bacterium]